MTLRRQQQSLGPFSLTLVAGARIALTGPNGTGKSSLLSAIAGLIPTNSGHLVVHRAVGYAPEPFAADPRMRVGELIRFIADACKGPVHTQAIVTLGLSDLLKHPLGELSRGQRKRALIAATLSGQPRVVLVDEPLEGLDAPSADAVIALIDAHQQHGGATIVATHRPERWDGPHTSFMPMSGP